MIDGEGGNRNIGPECTGALACKLLQALLERRVDRQTMKVTVGGSGNRRVRRMRGQYRHGPACDGYRLALGALALVRRKDAGRAPEHAVTRGGHRSSPPGRGAAPPG